MSAENTYNAILDGIVAFDDAMQRARRINELSAEVRAPNRCGECVKWMTKQCPREKSTMSGFGDGPHCNEPTCGQFVITPRYQELRDKKRADLEELERAP